MASSSSLAPGQIYSQPALTGAGSRASTILVTALDVLRAQRAPVRLEDFALTHGFTALIEDEGLRQRFKSHPRVQWNPKLDLWSFKPEHDLRSPTDLLHLLKSRYQSETSRCAGMKLSELRESYPQAREAIEEFTAVHVIEPPAEALKSNGDSDGAPPIGRKRRRRPSERQVLALRGKDGSVKMAFYNELQGKGQDDPEGYDVNGQVSTKDGPDSDVPDGEEELFRSLWSQVKVPDAVDLARQLEAEGLGGSSVDLIRSTASNSGANARGMGKRGGRGGKRGGGAGRRGKLQNTHLVGVDLSKDYTGES